MSKSDRYALIVLAHPEPKSFNAAMKDRAVEALSDTGWTVEVSDLYRQGFKAVADAEDFTGRADPDYLKYATEQAYAATCEGGFAPDIAAEIDKLKRADLLILQFPMWWFGLPAILKGWADRVFANSVIYGGEVGYFDQGLFNGRRAMVAYTTGSGPAAFGPTGMYGRADVILWPIEYGMLRFVGYDVLPAFQAAAPAKADDHGRRAILNAWEARLRAIDRTEPLNFHALADFGADSTLKAGIRGRTVAQTGIGGST